ncbi:hypothetical protein E4T49_01117 [Aureobasidium sp. EXF-10728]|nr:hypothetical protein E4T49_01117 [Aureobasidium sp. EXF-10728]
MHLWTPFALFACVSGLLVEKLDHAPHGWHDLGSASPSTRLNLTVSMALPNERLFEETLANISTPGHADYGKHLDRSELDASVRPQAIGTDTVLQWLKDSGVTESDVVEDGQWIKLTTNVQTAERMLKTSFDIYGRDSKHRGLLRTLRYEIPKEVAKYVDMVQPTTQFPIMSSKLDHSALSARAIPANCNETMTPDCLRKLYNAPLADSSKDTPTHGFIAVAGFEHQYPGSEDLGLFAKEYAPYIFRNFTCVYHVAAVDGSGDFSNFFPRPDWQEDTIRSYLDILGTRFTGLYNSSGRAFPDVSAQYFNYQIVHNRMEKSVEGTSASTPVLAGIIGQVNSALIGAGKSPLGFMNPFLYSVGHKAFKDVASGSSKGCGHRGSSVEGWNSVKGWDPVTGFGTPNYKKLLSIAMEQQV